jgi:hypothetical protein
VSRLARGSAALVAGAALAFGLAAATVAVRRPALMVAAPWCMPGARGPSGTCDRPLPVGGWPFPFLYDSPGTSVVGSLGPEDDLRPGWYLADAAVLALVPAALGTVVGVRRRYRRRRSPGAPLAGGTRPAVPPR